MKKALIHDWYTQYRGGERCVASITDIWKDFDYYTLVNTLSEDEKQFVFKGVEPTTSFIQRLPFGKKKYRSYLPLFPLAIEQFDLSDYELIISSSSCVAKGVITNHNQLHICYMHSPVRYAWDLYHQYLKESGLNRGLKGFAAKYFLHRLRIWDVATVNRPDFYIANSKYVANRIRKIYNKEAKVIYPPVETTKFEISSETSNYYVTCSSLVPYKKIDLIAKAFSNTDKRLIIIGDGPDYKKIKKISKPNIEMKGYLSTKDKKDVLKKARAFVFAAEEDFGIAPIEAQACGVPVIAFAKGGVLETIKGCFITDNVIEGNTGVFFKEQTIDSLLGAIEFFERHERSFDKQTIRKQAELFSKERFEKEFKKTIEKLYDRWRNRMDDNSLIRESHEKSVYE
ncbi:glycosyltransferase family 4 protein [Aquimarina sp. MMG015]|uniref:glycosyltransferase family 4 protein n=1 Tax=Aquimarina sp. MMG015 TaxID=2822689 RepID=UPI001B3A242D|nr:glycosyltransferase family 4 protein [Aquimarina sp. MMG015]MBQ4801395.1 glycosyltransferase family 4 protein [Aquimarina sp. MMG015]